MRVFAKQEEIVSLLKRGEMICCRISEHFGLRHQTIYRANVYSVTDGESSKRIHSSTMSAMIRNGIISGPNEDKSLIYKLLPQKEEKLVLNAWGQVSSRSGAQQRRMDRARKSHSNAVRRGRKVATYL